MGKFYKRLTYCRSAMLRSRLGLFSGWKSLMLLGRGVGGEWSLVLGRGLERRLALGWWFPVRGASCCYLGTQEYKVHCWKEEQRGGYEG